MFESRIHEFEFYLVRNSPVFDLNEFWNDVGKKFHRFGPDKPWNKRLMDVIEQVFQEGKFIMNLTIFLNT